MAPSNVMLEVNELTTKYITRFGEDIYAVDHVSLSVAEGKSVGIAGESGCGKSTLALSLMGYYFPPLHYTSGEIIIDGRNISRLPPDEVRRSILGTEIAYIPQSAMNALDPPQKIIRFHPRSGISPRSHQNQKKDLPRWPAKCF